jgi:hypothetical protein
MGIYTHNCCGNGYLYLHRWRLGLVKQQLFGGIQRLENAIPVRGHLEPIEPRTER